jgi:hypothetical protein
MALRPELWVQWPMPLATSTLVVILTAWAVLLVLLVAGLTGLVRRTDRDRLTEPDRRIAGDRRAGSDRRSARDRRTGSDRRSERGDRRIGLPDLRAQTVERRRGPPDRRTGIDRRSGEDRRHAMSLLAG